MRLLYVIQRYGENVAGGAEQHCREFAERLVVRGHRVDVLTTCALSYVNWENSYPEGRSELNGVTVYRVPVAQTRDADHFGGLNARMLHSNRLRPLRVQYEWMRMQGPYAPEIVPQLRARASSYDCTIFVTYLYWTAWAGLKAIGGAVPTILHPTAHDEPPLRLSIFDEVFRMPNAFAFLTPEEAALVEQRFPGAPAGEVVGVGVDLAARGDADAFRRSADLGDRPYLAYVGRIDPSKGAIELFEFFVEYKRRNPSDLALVFVGHPVVEVPERTDVFVTGFVDEGFRNSAVAGALALVHPSYFESFSMVLTEAFAQSRPALVQSRCAVMTGHAQRSSAAIPYAGFAEFEVAVNLLLERPALADAMGASGRRYVERDYDWDSVLDRYEGLLGRVAAGAPRLLAFLDG